MLTTAAEVVSNASHGDNLINCLELRIPTLRGTRPASLAQPVRLRQHLPASCSRLEGRDETVAHLPVRHLFIYSRTGQNMPRGHQPGRQTHHYVNAACNARYIHRSVTWSGHVAGDWFTFWHRPVSFVRRARRWVLSMPASGRSWWCCRFVAAESCCSRCWELMLAAEYSWLRLRTAGYCSLLTAADSCRQLLTAAGEQLIVGAVFGVFN